MLPELPDIGGALAHAIEPLLRPVTEVRDRAVGWREDFNAALMLWLADAVSYVGDRVGEAFMAISHNTLTALANADASWNLLTSIPLEWTVFSPVVWTLWGMMTAVFLAFAAPVLAKQIGEVRAARGQGALYDSHLHALTTTALGAAMGLFSLAVASLGVLLVVAIAAFLLQGASALPGMPVAQTPQAGLRNGALLFIYALAAALIWIERLCCVAMIGFCLVTSAWGVGGVFWPPARRFAGIWEGIYTPTVLTVLTQIILFRLGSETVNLAMATGNGLDQTTVGMGIGLAHIAVAVFSPGIVGVAYGTGAVPRFAHTVRRVGAAVLGINAVRIAGAVTRSGRSK